MWPARGSNILATGSAMFTLNSALVGILNEYRAVVILSMFVRQVFGL